MAVQSDIKDLVKILIGAAWVDGTVQPQEREYLQRMAQAKGVANDPELQPWLYELRSVSAAECYAWVKQYLGDRPSSEACQQLIENISALIYSDGNVANEEAKLLTQLQMLDPAHTAPENFHQQVVKAVQKLYRRWIDA